MPVRSDLVEKAAGLLNKGDLKGALRQYVTLFESDRNNWTIANTLGDLYVRVGNSEAAAAHFMSVAERLAADGFSAKARALYRKILRMQPDNTLALRRVEELESQTATASPFLQRVLSTARSARENRAHESAVAVEEPPASVAVAEPPPVAPSPAPPEPPVAQARRVDADDWTPIAMDLSEPAVTAPEPPVVVPAEAFGVPEPAVVVPEPTVVLPPPAPAAPAVGAAPAHQDTSIDALEREIADGVTRGVSDVALLEMQVRLAEACLDAGRFQQAQDIALDAIVRAPKESAPTAMLTRVAASARGGGHSLRAVPPLEWLVEPTLTFDDLTVPEMPAVAPEASEGVLVVDDGGEHTVTEIAAPHVPFEPEDQEFEELRLTIVEDAAAAAEERYAEASRMLASGQIAEAMTLLEDVMCLPHLRTLAGARLASVYRDRGEVADALACLEWVAELPPSSEEAGHTLAYELALTLEAMGEQEQALGIYRELANEVGSQYRDIAERMQGLAA